MQSESDNVPKYIITPQTVVMAQSYGDGTKEWLQQAMALNAALMTSVPQMNALAKQLIPEIGDRVKAEGKITGIDKGKGKAKFRESVKVFLLNVYTGYLMGVPVYYPRDANAYTKNSKYGVKFFTYKRVVPIANALIAAGYFEDKKGFFDPIKKTGLRSRVWASGKLLKLFQKYLLSQFQISELKERKLLVELRDKKKNSIKYKRTARTIKMEKNLRFYNDFIDKSNIEVLLNQNNSFSLNNISRVLLSSSLTGQITITNLTVIKNNITNINRTNKYISTSPFTHNVSWIDNSNNKLHTKKNELGIGRIPVKSTASLSSQDSTANTLSSQVDDAITGLNFKRRYDYEPVPIASTAIISRQDPAISLATLSLIIRKHKFLNRTDKYGKKFLDKDLIKDSNNEGYDLQHYGIQQVSFIINQKKLYRVFNLGKFTLGGRFYGAYHERIAEEYRKQITIDGQKVVELDYSAHHLRMPYHLKGIDYGGDPYLAITEDKRERKVFKKLCLVALNAPNEIEAINGFLERDDKGKVKDENLSYARVRDMLDKVKAVHQPIASYIHAAKGREFQYLDSQITEAILMRMTQQDIPCLPIHDSYIVPAQYEEQLQEAMTVEYRQLMKFDPVIDKK